MLKFDGWKIVCMVFITGPIIQFGMHIISFGRHNTHDTLGVRLNICFCHVHVLLIVFAGQQYGRRKHKNMI